MKNGDAAPALSWHFCHCLGQSVRRLFYHLQNFAQIQYSTKAINWTLSGKTGCFQPRRWIELDKIVQILRNRVLFLIKIFYFDFWQSNL